MISKHIKLIQRLIKTKRSVRYLIAGSVSEVIELFSFIILMGLFNALYINNSISFILGVVSGFYFHKTWTFKGDHQFKTHSQFIGYVSLAGVNFVMINIFIGYYVNHLHIHPSIAKLMAITSTLIWTYALTSLFIFKNRSTNK